MQVNQPSLQTVKRLFALSQNRCAFPSCSAPVAEESGTITGIICHIKARSKGGPRYDSKQTQEERHSFENLILLCNRHSKVVDSEPRTYTVDLLQEMKEIHERNGFMELSQSDARKAELLLQEYRDIYIGSGASVMVNSPHGIQAKTVVFKTQKSPTILPPDGSIASDLQKRNYTKHLIDRYHEFASEQGGRKFNYPAIYSEIKSHFGAKWDLVPLHRFSDLVEFLQRRIDRTMVGSMNRGKGRKNYSSFDEYLQKYGQAR
jgi:hypothetical protein